MAVSNDVLSLTGYDKASRWNREAPLGTSVVMTYSFPQKQSSYDTGQRPGYKGFSAAHVSHIEKALSTWEAVAGVSFVRVPEKVGGDIRFSMFDMTGYVNAVGKQVSGWGYYPSTYSTSVNGTTKSFNSYQDIGGDIYMNATFYAANANSMAPGIRGYMIVLHEIGHVLGFKHPFGGSPTISAAHDNGSYTVMSYDVAHSNVSLGSVDIEAMRHIYGTTDLTGKWNAKFKAVEQNGTTKSEWLLGSDHNDIIRGNRGNDTIRTKGGDDRIFDQGGNDRVSAGSGDDYVSAGLGADTFLGGTGTDTLSYLNSKRGVGVNLANSKTWGGAKGDKLSGFENLEGSRHNDTLSGSAFKNKISGFAGNDKLLGGSGNDDLLGGSGADTMFGGYGNDKLLGGNGNDRLSGINGNDTLTGGPGRDTLSGGPGDDTLIGGPGPDTLSGGLGRDTFVFAAATGKDTIEDFHDALDRLELKGFTFKTSAAALKLASQVGDDVVFTFGAQTKLTVEDVTIEALQDNVFV